MNVPHVLCRVCGFVDHKRPVFDASGFVRDWIWPASWALGAVDAFGGGTLVCPTQDALHAAGRAAAPKMATRAGTP